MRLQAVLLFASALAVHNVEIACHLTRRSLIYPSPKGVVQTIVGVGLPMTVRQESIVVGIVIKASYRLPTNSSSITSPGVQRSRRKRSPAAKNRWTVYKLLNELLALYGLGGRECVLRAICECASAPIDTSTSLVAEILHVLFDPTTTRDEIAEHADNEYHAAYRIGSDGGIDCRAAFPDCTGRFTDLFTSLA